MPLEGISGNLLTNLLDLSADMKCLLRSTLMTDITLCVGDKYMICCHKDILRIRSVWFSYMLDVAESKGVDLIEVKDENINIMEAVLCYIYTGNLQLVESLNVSLGEMYDAATKYGFHRLKEIFGQMLRERAMKEISKSAKFLWAVKVDDFDSLNAECPALDGFTTYKKDRWKLKIRSLGSSGDEGCSIGIFLSRQTEEPRTILHNVRFKISVIDSNGKIRVTFSDKHAFLKDDEYLLSKIVRLTGLAKESNSLLSDGALTLSCEIHFSAGVGYFMPFRLEGSYRRYISNELLELSHDMLDVFNQGDTNDCRFCLSDVKIHSYILMARSHLPSSYINELGQRARFGNLAWLSFAKFLYTGQPRYLDDHGRCVYTALCGTPYTMAKQKYSSFLAKNLTLENAFYVLSDAVCCGDDSLISAAEHFLASKSNIASDLGRGFALQLIRQIR